MGADEGATAKLAPRVDGEGRRLTGIAGKTESLGEFEVKFRGGEGRTNMRHYFAGIRRFIYYNAF